MHVLPVGFPETHRLPMVHFCTAQFYMSGFAHNNTKKRRVTEIAMLIFSLTVPTVSYPEPLSLIHKNNAWTREKSAAAILKISQI